MTPLLLPPVVCGSLQGGIHLKIEVPPLSPSSQKVQDTLQSLGFDLRVIEFEQTTRTSVEAAQAVGCEVGQIAKSLIFKGKQSGKAILIIASGVNRVDEKKIRALVGEKVEKPNADFVREQTGFVIGGVPPVAHAQKLETLIDEDLLKFEIIWGAAGTPNAVFRLAPQDLVKMTGGRVVDMKIGG
ncbi:MAG: YbaK/EbsC family protein [Chloroflexi bacterium]|nr:YbaK/EbsC family protein [Chloroflexota bacterium]